MGASSPCRRQMAAPVEVVLINNHSREACLVAGRQGFEPRYADPESAVLPLDDLPVLLYFLPVLAGFLQLKTLPDGTQPATPHHWQTNSNWAFAAAMTESISTYSAACVLPPRGPHSTAGIFAA